MQCYIVPGEKQERQELRPAKVSGTLIFFAVAVSNISKGRTDGARQCCWSAASPTPDEKGKDK